MAPRKPYVAETSPAFTLQGSHIFLSLCVPLLCFVIVIVNLNSSKICFFTDLMFLFIIFCGWRKALKLELQQHRENSSYKRHSLNSISPFFLLDSACVAIWCNQGYLSYWPSGPFSLITAFFFSTGEELSIAQRGALSFAVMTDLNWLHVFLVKSGNVACPVLRFHSNSSPSSVFLYQ